MNFLNTINRIETSFEETQSLEIRISGYLAGIRAGTLPAKQERRALNNLNAANAKLEKLRAAA